MNTYDYFITIDLKDDLTPVAVTTLAFNYFENKIPTSNHKI